ncbi:MAG: type II secretion system F family protein [Gemmatimonadota bacterium]
MTTAYRYRAATAAGQIREGVLQAISRETVLRDLRSQDLTPIRVERAEVAATVRRRLPGMGAPPVWSVARELATLLDAGLPLDGALETVIRSAGHPGLTGALVQIREDVRGGATFSESLARHPRYFPSLVPALVRAGEATGALDTVMDQVANHLEEGAELRSQVRAALLYPVLMACVATLGILVLLVFVIPRFAAILLDVGGQLPLTTRMLVLGGSVLTQWWWLVVGLGIGLGVAARRAFQTPATRERFDGWRLGLPWVGELERRFIAAHFTQTLGLLLGSGVGIVEALRIAGGTIGNRAARGNVERATVRVAEGASLASSLEGTLPAMAVRMLAVGEESGRLEDLCSRVGRAYSREVRRILQTGVSIIEPALILVFGVLVGFVAIAMLQAIYSINTGAFR